MIYAISVEVVKHVPVVHKEYVKVPVHVPQPYIVEKHIPTPVHVDRPVPVPVKVNFIEFRILFISFDDQEYLLLVQPSMRLTVHMDKQLFNIYLDQIGKAPIRLYS